jgi:Spy/CpxP family protein refolding chaperone
MRKRITLLIAALMMALTMSFGGAAAAFADNPHAGGSGKFKGSSNPCKNDGADKKCPPHGGS